MAITAAPTKHRSLDSSPGPSGNRSLIRAFQTFTQDAGSLEKSYGQLQAEVLRLCFELERTKRDLKTSLEENARMRRYFARIIIKELSCGVLRLRRERMRLCNSADGSLEIPQAVSVQSVGVVP